jgi:hypothetical protein
MVSLLCGGLNECALEETYFHGDSDDKSKKTDRRLEMQIILVLQ